MIGAVIFDVGECLVDETREYGTTADLHVHDLRHTGNTLTAEAGASFGELMNRMGHSSTRAARIYLYARDEREWQLAVTLGRIARRELKASGATRSAD